MSQPGWKPDPSWPPLPPGWQLWVSDDQPDYDTGDPGSSRSSVGRHAGGAHRSADPGTSKLSTSSSSQGSPNTRTSILGTGPDASPGSLNPRTARLGAEPAADPASRLNSRTTRLDAANRVKVNLDPRTSKLTVDVGGAGHPRSGDSQYSAVPDAPKSDNAGPGTPDSYSSSSTPDSYASSSTPDSYAGQGMPESRYDSPRDRGSSYPGPTAPGDPLGGRDVPRDQYGSYGDPLGRPSAPGDPYGGQRGPSDAYSPPAGQYSGPSDAYGPPAGQYAGPSDAYGPPAGQYAGPSDAYGPAAGQYSGPGIPGGPYPGADGGYGSPGSAYPPGGPSYSGAGQYSPYGGPAVPAGPHGGYNSSRPGTSGWAVASLIFGIIGGVIVSAILGGIALSKIGRTGQRGRGMAIAGIVLTGVWVLVIAVVVNMQGQATRAPNGKINKGGSLSVFSLQTGDCFQFPSSLDGISSVKAIPCTQSHDAQVFAEYNLTGSSYPSNIQKVSNDGCNTRMQALNTSAVTNSDNFYSFFPQQGAWDNGSRGVQCVIVTPSDSTNSLLKS